MELMLIVWLVSILSGIKAFVSSYLLYIVALAIGLFAMSKVNKSFILLLRKGVHQSWRDGELVLQDDLQIKDQTIPAGSEIYLNSYVSYGYVTFRPLGVSNVRVEREELEPKITFTVNPLMQESSVSLLAGSTPSKLSWLCYILIALQLLLPTDNTMKYMAGAYLIQSTYDSEFVQTALPLGQKAVLNQLKRWSEDSEELKDLLVEQVKEPK